MTLAAVFSRGRWQAPALFASLVLNGFLVGMVVADALNGGRRGPPHIGGFELRRLSERLPRDALRQIEGELEARRPELQARFDRLRGMREDLNRLAAQPAPDRAAIDDRLAALRTEASALQEDVQRTTYDALLRLPPEVRSQLAEKPADR